MSKTIIDSNYDVVICGGGPAGCSTAMNLDDNYKTLLIDKNSFPRDKPCGGMLVEESIELVKKLNPPNEIFTSPKHIDLKCIDWNNDTVIDEKRDFWNLSRKNFDYWLLEKARQSIDIAAGVKLLKFEDKKKNVELTIAEGRKIRTLNCNKLILACGPHNGTKTPINKTRIKKYTAVQEWILPNKTIGNYTYFIFDNDITDYYSWLVPKDDYLVIGSAFPMNGNHKTSDLFQKLKESIFNHLKIQGESFKMEAHMISRPLDINTISLCNGNVFYVGENAGFISPTTGEGISFSLRSGYNCATAINTDIDGSTKIYEELSTPLIDEMKMKINKAKELSDPTQRKRCFNRS